MISENTQWYLDAVIRELAQLEEGRFTGNVNFQFNYKEGSVANINIGLNKSIKRIERPK